MITVVWPNHFLCRLWIVPIRDLFSLTFSSMGPSIYDVHTEGGGGHSHVDACGRGRRGPAPCGRPHRKLKLQSTDVILSSYRAKKLASFLPAFHRWTEKNRTFFCDIN